MRERPILFSGDMVRAILAGTKTQTRRPVKHDLANAFDPPRGPEDVAAGYPWFEDGDGNWHKAVDVCPYGQPGDRLWVRETWHSDRATHPIFAFYRADGDDGKLSWRPSIHMPRWACRLMLEIVSVRVELVLDISDADARAEGFADRMAFMDAWEATYVNKLGTALFGWVWVIEFKLTEASA